MTLSLPEFDLELFVGAVELHVRTLLGKGNGFSRRSQVMMRQAQHGKK